MMLNLHSVTTLMIRKRKMVRCLPNKLSIWNIQMIFYKGIGYNFIYHQKNFFLVFSNQCIFKCFLFTVLNYITKWLFANFIVQALFSPTLEDKLFTEKFEVCNVIGNVVLKIELSNNDFLFLKILFKIFFAVTQNHIILEHFWIKKDEKTEYILLLLRKHFNHKK